MGAGVDALGLVGQPLNEEDADRYVRSGSAGVNWSTEESGGI
jgi:hypothetical protein